MKAFLGKLYAKSAAKKIKQWSSNPIETQEIVFKENIKLATNTLFGKDHNFSSIKSYSDFSKNVPVLEPNIF